MKILKYFVSSILFIGIIALGVKIVSASLENQRLKHDYAEINHFKYGLFNVDEWKGQLSGIISDEIDDLSLSKENKRTIKKHLEKQLGVFIDKVYARFEKSYDDSPFTKGLIKSFVDMEEIKKGIPEYATAIMKELSTSKSEKQIKSMLKEKIDKYMAETFSNQEATKKDAIIADIGVQKEEVANEKLQHQIKENQQTIWKLSIIVIAAAIILFTWEFFSKTPLHIFHYIILSFVLIMFLFIGVTTPMIDMEAKISKFSFVLFNHPIEFKNQILYFQSKSILDVFNVMIHHKEAQMKVVGVLVICFSVIFPILKMLSSIAYYYNYCNARRRKLIQFFVLKSGKWSMADVLVVAIFMAYIGFNGIINSQLNNMGQAAQGIDLITTNGTSLQPGFYIFLSYVILAMFLSILLERRPKEC